MNDIGIITVVGGVIIYLIGIFVTYFAFRFYDEVWGHAFDRGGEILLSFLWFLTIVCTIILLPSRTLFKTINNYASDMATKYRLSKDKIKV